LTSIEMVEIRGVMTDCPERLTTGAGMIVMLRFYFLPAAFKPLKVTSDDVIITGFNEGQETEAERYTFVLRPLTQILF